MGIAGWVCTSFEIGSEPHYYRHYDYWPPPVEVESVEQDAEEHGLLPVLHAKYDFWWDAVASIDTQ